MWDLIGAAVLIASDGLPPHADGAGARGVCFETSEGKEFVPTDFQLLSVVLEEGASPVSDVLEDVTIGSETLPVVARIFA